MYTHVHVHFASCYNITFFPAGKYPAEAVAIMSHICLEAEAAMFHSVVFGELRSLTRTPTSTVQTIAIAAVDASFQQNASAIITLTTSGKTAFVISRYRPRCPIIAVTRDAHAARIVSGTLVL